MIKNTTLNFINWDIINDKKFLPTTFRDNAKDKNIRFSYLYHKLIDRTIPLYFCTPFIKTLALLSNYNHKLYLTVDLESVDVGQMLPQLTYIDNYIKSSASLINYQPGDTILKAYSKALKLTPLQTDKLLCHVVKYNVSRLYPTKETYTSLDYTSFKKMLSGQKEIRCLLVPYVVIDEEKKLYFSGLQIHSMEIKYLNQRIESIYDKIMIDAVKDVSI